MKIAKKIMIIEFSIIFSCSLMITSAIAKQPSKNGPKKAKNIIFMVPDGQGLPDVTAARIYKNGINGAPLYQETLENIGYQRTYSADSTVTDSAAAASAWAVGQKFLNGEISCHGVPDTGDCIDEVPTILELAEKMGKATGLVATSQISHATPAAFGAQVFSRNCGVEIARQYIADAGVDVILGGGIYKADPIPDYCGVYSESYVSDPNEYIIQLAETDGYAYVTDKGQLDAAVAAGKLKILGMFQQNGIGEGKTPEMFRVGGSPYPVGEPTLPQMTDAALDVLEKDKDGFFLVVEGSQIDWADHANEIDYQIAESLAFDESVGVVLEWVNRKADRKNQTLIIIVADHDCGGFAVNGPYGILSEEPGEVVVAGWTSTDHTGVDTIIYSQGPGSENLNAAVDNTDLYFVMESVLH